MKYKYGIVFDGNLDNLSALLSYALYQASDGKYSHGKVINCIQQSQINDEICLFVEVEVINNEM